MSTYVVKVEKDEEVLETLGRAAEAFAVEHGSITLIGAVQQATVSVMPKDSALDDILTDYDQPFELTGTGEVVDGKVHVHVSLGGDLLVVAGHLHRAVVRDWFVRAYITDLG